MTDAAARALLPGWREAYYICTQLRAYLDNPVRWAPYQTPVWVYPRTVILSDWSDALTACARVHIGFMTSAGLDAYQYILQIAVDRWGPKIGGRVLPYEIAIELLDFCIALVKQRLARAVAEMLA